MVTVSRELYDQVVEMELSGMRLVGEAPPESNIDEIAPNGAWVGDGQDEGDDDDEESCASPCHPDQACDECAEYWNRMRDEGLWQDGVGWTDAGMREMLK